jgi:hypothetical protein
MVGNFGNFLLLGNISWKYIGNFQEIVGNFQEIFPGNKRKYFQFISWKFYTFGNKWKYFLEISWEFPGNFLLF